MFWAVWNHEVLDANPNASWYFFEQKKGCFLITIIKHLISKYK